MSTIACAQPQDSTAKTQQIEPTTHKEDGEVGQTGTAAVDMNETEAAGFYCGACMQSECLDCAAACYPSVGCYSYAPGPYPCPYPYAYGAYPPHPPAASEEYTDPYFGEYANGQVPYSGAPYFAGCPECAQCAECSYCSYGQPPMYNESACPPPWLAQSEEVSPSIGAVPMQPAAFEHAQELQPACCAAELPVAVEEEGASPAGVELTPEQLHSVDPVRYKTRLCTAFQQGKQCEYGERCLFAHGPDDLRFPASNFAALLRAGKLPRHIRKYYTAKFLGEDVEEIPASAS